MDNIVPEFRPITNIELYALARALQGKDWQEYPMAGWLRHAVGNAQAQGNPGLKAFQAALPILIGTEATAALFAVDPDAKPPAMSNKASAQDDFDVPDLPESCRLTPAQERQADDVGQWERDYVAWAGAQMNQTPVAYHQLIAICLISIAIGRRCYIASTWQQDIFPNQYGIILGTTTYHRKSTGLNTMKRIAEEAFPHLLMPRPGSTENFGNMLAGRWETDGLSPEDKAELEKARPFAGQRAIIRDEISGLFRSFGRDYMAGLKEELMDMYEAPRSHKLSTNSRGLVIARNIAPTLIGASTPAGMSSALSRRDWEDGNLARFALITVEANYSDRPRPAKIVSSDRFIYELKALHERLPQPVNPALLGSPTKADPWSLVAPIWDYVIPYADSLREMTNPKRADALDNRLRGTYGRHHVKACKIALALAVMDWHLANPVNGKNLSDRPQVTESHWFRALQIAESWRASAHRFLQEMTVSDDAEAMDRTYQHLLRWPEGETKSELLKRTSLSRMALDQALDTLIDSGKIEAFKRNSGHGPAATVYRSI